MSTLMLDSTAYAVPSDLTARYDVRDIAQWASDTGTPVSTASIATNVNVLAALADASGMVEAACLAADRYTVSDLQNLAGGSGNSSNFIKRLTCDLAVGMLIERRYSYDRDLPRPCQQALVWLEELRAGKRIFAFQEVADAGNPKVTYQSQSDIAKRNLASFQAARFFGADRAEEFVPSTGSANVVP